MVPIMVGLFLFSWVVVIFFTGELSELKEEFSKDFEISVSSGS